MSDLEVRRVVTGHDENGMATIAIDETMAGTPIRDEAEFVMVWSTDTFPSDNADEFDGARRQVRRTSPGGSLFQRLDLMPGKRSSMHRTHSLDYGVVLEGEIDLELDNGVVAHLKAGDTIVQRGTIHAWVNNSDAVARMVFVLIDADPLVIDGRELAPVG